MLEMLDATTCNAYNELAMHTMKQKIFQPAMKAEYISDDDGSNHVILKTLGMKFDASQACTAGLCSNFSVNWQASCCVKSTKHE